MARGRAAIFLDRDGTLIQDTGYPRDPGSVRLLPGAAEALAELRARGLALVLVSNQSGVGRGMLTAQDVKNVHDRLLAELARGGVTLDRAYYCLHAPEDGCACRKPSAGLLWTAARELGLDLTRSFVVRDKPTDMEAGVLAWCRTVLLRADSAPPASAADYVASGWREALSHILGVEAGGGWRR